VLAPFVIWGSLAAVLMALGVRRPSDRQVGAFARAYAVPLTAETSELIRSNVIWIRRWRYAGAAVACSAVAVGSIIVDDRLGLGRFAAAIAFGFAVGSVIAEIRKPRPGGASIAAAWTEQRLISHYIAPWSYRIVALAGLIVAGHFALIGSNRWFDLGELEDPRDALPRTAMVWLVIGWAGLAAFCVLALRRLTIAPEPMATPAQHVVNRAVRSSAFITVLGATLMGFSMIGGQIIWPIISASGSTPQIIRWMHHLVFFSILMGVPCGWLIAVNSLPNIGTYLRVPRVVRDPVAQVAGP
jgi:hypothetical protein